MLHVAALHLLVGDALVLVAVTLPAGGRLIAVTAVTVLEAPLEERMMIVTASDLPTSENVAVALFPLMEMIVTVKVFRPLCSFDICG
jgi:hypothetical protein